VTQSTPAAAPAAPAAAAPAAPASLIPDASAAAAAPAAAPATPAKPGSLIPDAPAAAAPAAAPAAPVDPNSPDAWLLAEGVQGPGKRPEWFKNDKYRSVEDQAKAYPELEKRFGAFVGAPKDGKYTFTPPEGLPHTIDEAHPLTGDFNKWATEHQLSQGGYNELMGMLLQYEISHQPDLGAIKTGLGEKADERITAVAQWGQANLDAGGYKALREATSGANAAAVFTVLEALIGKTRQVKLPPPGADVSGAQADKLAAINAKKAVKNPDGKSLRYFTDEQYRAGIDKELNAYYAEQQKAA
jgi:hypothetical protein